MTVVKITVLETSLKKELADEYAVPNLEPCPILKAGQVFCATNTCPKGMCDAAWRTINQYVFSLACGVREFYGGGRRAWLRAERYLGIIALFALGATLGSLAVPKLGIRAIWCSCVLLVVSFALMFEKRELEQESKTE